MHLNQEIFEKDFDRRKIDLKSRLEAITHFTENEAKRHYRCKGYYREIELNYSLKKFIFAPNDLIIDRYGILSICVGVARSPDILEGDVLWLLSEKEAELHYISECMPEILRRDYQLAA